MRVKLLKAFKKDYHILHEEYEYRQIKHLYIPCKLHEGLLVRYDSYMAYTKLNFCKSYHEFHSPIWTIKEAITVCVKSFTKDVYEKYPKIQKERERRGRKKADKYLLIKLEETKELLKTKVKWL
tara:strand:- start:282 stop:653 length:372 start_codon:yes stop_codon:yes gene_type:complete